MGCEAWGQPGLSAQRTAAVGILGLPTSRGAGNSDPFRFLAHSLVAVIFLYCRKLDLLCFFPWITSCSSLVRAGVAGDSKGQAVLGADPSSSSLSLVLSRVRLMVGHERVSHWGSGRSV